MPLMQWKESYSTGILKMDEQHKKWMELINSFYDNLTTNNLKNNLEKTLDEAIEYTLYHFDEEEAFMKQIGYPELETQMQEHEKIREKLNDFKTRLGDGRMNVSQPVTSELKSWFNSHVTEMDKGYGKFYNKSMD